MMILPVLHDAAMAPIGRWAEMPPRPRRPPGPVISRLFMSLHYRGDYLLLIGEEAAALNMR